MGGANGASVQRARIPPKLATPGRVSRFVLISVPLKKKESLPWVGSQSDPRGRSQSDPRGRQGADKQAEEAVEVGAQSNPPVLGGGGKRKVYVRVDLEHSDLLRKVRKECPHLL